MANLTCRIGRTDIKKVDYNKELNIQPNQQIQLQIKTQSRVLYNAERPLDAVVHTVVTIQDEATNLLHMNIETLTPITASSFIDNMEEVVKVQYIPVVNIIVAEKVKEISAYVGTPINLPPISLPVADASDKETWS